MLRKFWTNEEIQILKDNYPYEDIKDFLHLLNNKTEKQVRSKVKLEKIKRIIKFPKKPRTYKFDDIIKCKICHKEYKYEDQMFSRNRVCKKCKNDMELIKFYKNSYGICLDNKLMFNTYDIIQWYKWTISEKTPNNKYLNYLPKTLLNFDNIKIIVKYVIEDILKWKTREEKLKLTQPIINKYKISFSKTEGIKNSSYNLLQLTYPELNFQPWEMVHATNKFWANYNNFLMALKFYVYEILDDNMRNNIELYFCSKYIEDLFPKLNHQKLIYYNNKSWKDILNDINIKYNVNNNLKSTYDGTILKSMEEVTIYNYVHNSMNIKTLKSSSKKYIFKCNNGIDNKYIPDFIITQINNIKLDKPCIIEYYGLFFDKYKIVNTKTDEILNNYRSKTFRKNNFYKNNPDIYFIDLYPEDIKNNFEGVRQKLTSFFMSNFNIDIFKLKEVI